MVGNGLARDCFAFTAQFDRHWTIDRQPVVCAQSALLAYDFNGSTIRRAIRHRHGSQRPTRELQEESGRGFYVVRAVVRGRGGSHADDLVLQDETQRVDAVNADIDNWAAARQFSIVQPLARMLW